MRLIRSFNRTKFRKERSLMHEVQMSEKSNPKLASLVEQHINMVNSYKGMLILMEKKWINVDRNALVQKIMKEFDRRAKYSFNSSNDLFIKFLARVFENNLWEEQFDKWVNSYVEENAKKMHVTYSMQLQQTLQTYGCKNNYLETLDKHIKSIEDAKKCKSRPILFFCQAFSLAWPLFNLHTGFMTHLSVIICVSIEFIGLETLYCAIVQRQFAIIKATRKCKNENTQENIKFIHIIIFILEKLSIQSLFDALSRIYLYQNINNIINMLTQQQKDEMVKRIQGLGFQPELQALIPKTLENAEWDEEVAVECLLSYDIVDDKRRSQIQNNKVKQQQASLIKQQPQNQRNQNVNLAQLQEAQYQQQQAIENQQKLEEEQMAIIMEQSLEKQDEMQLSERQRPQGYPVGLQNFGNTCYFNCILQILFANPTLQQTIFEYRPDKSQKQDIVVRQQEFMKQLQLAMARLMLSNEKYRKPEDVYKASKALRQVENKNLNDFKIGQFSDVSEYLEVILSLIDQSILNRKSEQEFNAQLVFESQILKDEYCIEKKQQDQQEHLSSQLMLNPTDQFIYQSLFQEFSDKQRQPQLKKMPNNLVFTLQRTSHEQNKQVKYEGEYWFSTQLYLDFLFDDEVAINELQEYFHKSQSSVDITQSNQLLKKIAAFERVIKLYESKSIVPIEVVHSLKVEMNEAITESKNFFPRNIDALNEKLKENSRLSYHLYLIVIHTGSAHTGHYYMYARNFCLNKWFKYNDYNVTVEMEDDVLKDSRKNGNMLIYISESQKGKVTQYQAELKEIEQKLFQSINLTRTDNSKLNALKCIPIKMIGLMIEENNNFSKEYQENQQVIERSKIVR